LHKPKSVRNGQGQYYRAMTARFWTQGAGYQESIPSNGCTASGINVFIVNITVIEVFYNPPIPVPAGYTPIYPPESLFLLVQTLLLIFTTSNKKRSLEDSETVAASKFISF
ncbi:4920_t:CDS:2, partial [Scutellospora calospora]